MEHNNFVNVKKILRCWDVINIFIGMKKKFNQVKIKKI